MSKIKKLLERALKVETNTSNVFRFCADVEKICDYWDWNGYSEKDEEEFQEWLNGSDELFFDIPEQHRKTATYLMSLAFQSYMDGQDGAGKIIIAVLNQWDNDYANE
jgi:hypothetical protein